MIEDLLDGIGHLRARRRLGDEPHRAIGDCLQHHLLVLLGRDDHHRDRRRLVAQVDQPAKAMHAGHVQVQQDQVQVVMLAGQAQGAVQVGGFHDLAAREAVSDDVVDRFAKQRVVVGDQNLVHGFAPYCCG
jgi:hypothetical protein